MAISDWLVGWLHLLARRPVVSKLVEQTPRRSMVVLISCSTCYVPFARTKGLVHCSLRGE